MVKGATSLSARPWSSMRWLVLAPHADDETLGTGALIAQMAAKGQLGAIVYLTDGTGSHPGLRGLKSIRTREATHAVRRLAGTKVPIIEFGWRDAHPFDVDEGRFARDARRLGGVLGAGRIDALAVTARNEAHCDHEAAFHLASAAIARVHRPVQLFEYHIWSEPRSGPVHVVRTDPMLSGRRRLALCAHRSQLSGLHGPGFRLPAEKLRMPPQDYLYAYQEGS